MSTLRILALRAAFYPLCRRAEDRKPFKSNLRGSDEDLARTHVSYYSDDAKRTKGIYRKRIQKAWGHTAHRGWARLLLDRTRDLIIHGSAHRGANGVAMPTDEDDPDLFLLSRSKPPH